MYQSVAVLTVFGPAGMTDAGRRKIAAWLRRQAGYLVTEGAAYSRQRFIARYLRQPVGGRPAPARAA
mgnify:CR=1 FL=1